ncbi:MULTISPECIES: alpha/beta hydrolase [unclassified Pseudoxanthomonas]|uniref:alpha/beta hydrolase n=1 Tax=unclassified Pseudoxanthomonas TaxID=2645906 RepID=UPI00307F1192
MRAYYVVVLLICAISTACTHVAPKRTSLSGTGDPPGCNAPTGEAPTNCEHQIVERSDDYDLHFIEFDDQGRPYADNPDFGDAHKQIDEFLLNVERTAKTEAGVSVVVFVHGWLHSSDSEDGNLESFRRVLGQLAKVENLAFCRRKVIGVYVGWRGAATVFGRHPVDTLSFWSRKFAAEQVATGSFQQVVAGLKAMQSATPDRIEKSRSLQEANCSSRLKTMYVGHSFGGLIIVSSMAQDLSRGLMLDQLGGESSLGARAAAPRTRSDELVVAINPAIESARFDALFRIASTAKYPYYRPPRFIAITSKNDWATGRMFPAGRTVNLITKRFPRGDNSGRSAARRALGHDPNYLTRTLAESSHYTGDKQAAERYCADADAELPLAERAKLDVARARNFHAAVGGSYDANKPEFWPRAFCVKDPDDSKPDVLIMDAYANSDMDRNTPIWNISTGKPIVKDHGDIESIRLIEFLRQIYVDTMFFR